MLWRIMMTAAERAEAEKAMEGMTAAERAEAERAEAEKATEGMTAVERAEAEKAMTGAP